MSQSPYTTNASSAVMQAEVVKTRMASKPVGAKTPRKLGIQDPSGPSTQGGRTARQSLLLVAGSESAVCGWVDFVTRQCELKTYAATAAVFLRRYGKAFDVTPDEYEKFCDEFTAVVRDFKISVSLAESEDSYVGLAPVTSSGGGSEGVSSGRLIAVIVLAMITGVSLTVMALWLLR